MRLFTSAFLFAITLFAHSTLLGATPDRVYFGTYTKTDSKGIYVSDWDAEKGTLSKPVLAAEIENPSFLELSSNGKFLYAVSEVGEGAVKAFRVLDDGTLEFINQQSAEGSITCHLSISTNGKILVIANYMGGNVASYRIHKNGSLSKSVSVIQHKGSSVNPKRQEAPHAHSINFSHDDRFAYAADLGTDRIYRYAVDPTKGTLTASGETVIEAGAGPRHFAFHTSGKFAYVINELALTVEAFSVNQQNGELTSLQTVSTLPVDTPKQGSTAEVVCHPSGKFVYGSNRGHDTIVVYQIDPSSGKLNYVENEPIQGEVPRNFALSPDGCWLIAAGQKSNTASVFSIDPESGELTFTGEQKTLSSPVCIRFRSGEN
ncbi:lactonase family protein [Verrucomicrobiales bacterium]|nr:lactonase family protein [Verrucomicrobiales bacterium]